ncbi:hypothetical protein TNCV_3821651 [Trichonephila clavipes]|nr:hypothetical protein TNCV_3821651 [Trichonephila clavipes]
MFQLSTELACIATLHGGSLWFWARTRDKASHDTYTTRLPWPQCYSEQRIQGHHLTDRYPIKLITRAAVLQNAATTHLWAWTRSV